MDNQVLQLNLRLKYDDTNEAVNEMKRCIGYTVRLKRKGLKIKIPKAICLFIFDMLTETPSGESYLTQNNSLS